MEENKSGIPVCAVDYAFQRIGGKYKGRILWHLHEQKILRYGELKKKVIGVTTKMLTQTLRELETDKLIVREIYPQVPPKVEYSLTDSGRNLIPFINYLRQWAQDQLNEEVS